MGNYQTILCCPQNSNEDTPEIESINEIKEANTNSNLPYLSMGSNKGKNISHKKQLFLYSHNNDIIKSIFLEDVVNTSSINIKKIIFGKTFFLGLLEDNNNKTYLVGYGDNSTGQLGLNVNTEYYESNENNNPKNYYDYLLLINVFKQEEVILDISTQGNFSYILVKDTKLNKTYIVKFGLNEEEILKLRTVSVKEINPIKIEECYDQIINTITHICAMKYRTILTSSDSIYIKGSLFNMNYNRTYKLFKKFENKTIEKLLVGIGHLVLELNDGTLYTMGNNEYGELGVITNDKNNFHKVNFFLDKKIKKISTGFRHTLVLCEDGNLYAFGENSFGQCFGKDIKCEPNIINVANNNEKIVNCFAGADYSLLITESNNIYAWGNCDFIVKDELNQINDVEEKKMRCISDMELKNVKDIFCGINHILFYTEVEN
jgi:alpha-tubulin suppressor-like RCC1 family protein